MFFASISEITYIMEDLIKHDILTEETVNNIFKKIEENLVNNIDKYLTKDEQIKFFKYIKDNFYIEEKLEDVNIKIILEKMKEVYQDEEIESISDDIDDIEVIRKNNYLIEIIETINSRELNRDIIKIFRECLNCCK